MIRVIGAPCAFCKPNVEQPTRKIEVAAIRPYGTVGYRVVALVARANEEEVMRVWLSRDEAVRLIGSLEAAVSEADAVNRVVAEPLKSTGYYE